MSRLRRLWREPLAHFLLIGAFFFVLFGLTRERDSVSPNRIVVDSTQIAQLAAQFRGTWLRPPSDTELAGLIQSHVRDEVFYREALAMGLDQEDPLIRRRLRQKLEFILEDLTAEETPDDDVLDAFLEDHADDFRLEPRISFRQIYLNPDKHGDIEAYAKTLLSRLARGAPPESVGDATMLTARFERASASEIGGMFGEGFAREVTALSPGGWTGPVYSGLGAHLVEVRERIDGRLPSLDEVRAAVEREYLTKRRQELKDQAYQRLLEGYDVILEPGTRQPARLGEAAAAPAIQGDGQ